MVLKIDRQGEIPSAHFKLRAVCTLTIIIGTTGG